ncbi:MAG TPA: glycosyltransferase family 9 protein [Fimbriimonas sp.]|nr:glycosyltransferase family 9 protein [Fimbriimonas sp.]
MTDPCFLLIRFAAIGDCVMAAWAATSIKLAHPGSTIVWPIEERCSPVVDGELAVSEIFPRERWKENRWSASTWREQIHKYAKLRRWSFDFGIDLHGHLKSSLCLRLACPRRRLAAKANDEISKRLNPCLPSTGDPMHMVEWNQFALNQLGEFPMPERPMMPFTVGAVDPCKITISLGASEADKKYPLDSWRQVAAHLIGDGFDVRFLGGPNDASITGLGMDLVGKLTLRESMNEIASSRLHLAADTGSGHIAAAYGVPVVSIFGRTDPARFRPYTPFGEVLRNGDVPSNVPYEEVISAAYRLLEASHAVSH